MSETKNPADESAQASPLELRLRHALRVLDGTAPADEAPIDAVQAAFRLADRFAAEAKDPAEAPRPADLAGLAVLRLMRPLVPRNPTRRDGAAVRYCAIASALGVAPDRLRDGGFDPAPRAVPRERVLAADDAFRAWLAAIAELEDGRRRPACPREVLVLGASRWITDGGAVDDPARTLRRAHRAISGLGRRTHGLREPEDVEPRLVEEWLVQGPDGLLDVTREGIDWNFDAGARLLRKGNHYRPQDQCPAPAVALRAEHHAAIDDPMHTASDVADVVADAELARAARDWCEARARLEAGSKARQAVRANLRRLKERGLAAEIAKTWNCDKGDVSREIASELAALERHLRRA